jgi:hypothetical protein
LFVSFLLEPGMMGESFGGGECLGFLLFLTCFILFSFVEADMKNETKTIVMSEQDRKNLERIQFAYYYQMYWHRQCRRYANESKLTKELLDKATEEIEYLRSKIPEVLALLPRKVLSQVEQKIEFWVASLMSIVVDCNINFTDPTLNTPIPNWVPTYIKITRF